MPDIAECLNHSCTQRDKCDRAQVKPYTPFRNYLIFDGGDDCAHFRPVEAPQIENEVCDEH